MLKALRQLLQQDGDPDLFLPVIASTLRSAAASIELEKVEQLGSPESGLLHCVPLNSKDSDCSIFEVQFDPNMPLMEFCLS